MTVNGATNFSGTISGALSPVFNGSASLSGLEDYTGGATIEGSSTLANAGTYDIVSNNLRHQGHPCRSVRQQRPL